MFCKIKDELIVMYYQLSNKGLEEIFTAKISEKKILYKVFGGGIYSKNSSIKKIFFLYFLYIKVLDTKNGCNINGRV